MGFWWTWIGKMGDRAARRDSRLADEASAYLQGWLLEWQWVSGPIRPFPPSLWLNALAQGDLARLRELAEAPRPGVAVASWRQVRGVLAHALLVRTGGDPAAVAAVQREALVPLESQLDNMRDLTPARMHQIAVQEMALIEL
jgi:hypothetical protein